MPELNARDPGKTEATAGEVLGHVHSVTGAQASIGLLSARGLHHAGATVGKFIKIHTGKALLIGVITDVSLLVSPNIVRLDASPLAGLGSRAPEQSQLQRLVGDVVRQRPRRRRPPPRRFRLSWMVERAAPRRRPISRALTPPW